MKKIVDIFVIENEEQDVFVGNEGIFLEKPDFPYTFYTQIELPKGLNLFYFEKYGAVLVDDYCVEVNLCYNRNLDKFYAISSNGFVYELEQIEPVEEEVDPKFDYALIEVLEQMANDERMAYEMEDEDEEFKEPEVVNFFEAVIQDSLDDLYDERDSEEIAFDELNAEEFQKAMDELFDKKDKDVPEKDTTYSLEDLIERIAAGGFYEKMNKTLKDVPTANELLQKQASNKKSDPFDELVDTFKLDDRNIVFLGTFD